MARWVLLAYHLPREPSTPRITLWRSLRRLGVAKVADGVVALPHDAHTREQLEWLAEDVIERGGHASIWIAEPGSAAQERALARQMADDVAREYERVIAEASKPGARLDRRTQSRLRREMQRITARDYFPTATRRHARRVVEAMLDEEVVSA